MIRRDLFSIVFILFFFSSSWLLVYSQVDLLKDINTSGNSFAGGFTEFSGQIFFSAYEEVNGRELWVTDGSAAGTVLFKDINPGTGSGFLGEFTVFNNEFYFFGSDGNVNNGLWKSDGTPEGTQFVAPVENAASSYGLIGFENQLYFSTLDSDGYELWTSDGTAEGTKMVKDIYEGSSSSDPAEFTIFDGKLFFVATPSIARRVLYYVENGEVYTVDYGGADDERFANNPDYLTVFKDGLYFSADFRTGGFNWRYKQLGKIQAGTNDVTIITRINGTEDGNVADLVAGNNFLLFTAEEESTGAEYWISDGTSEGTEILMDINPGSASALNATSNAVAAGNLFFFNASDDVHGEELWMTDGTEVGTRVLDLNPGDASSFPRTLTVYRNTLLLTAETPEAGREVWTSLGNIEETLLVQDLLPGGSSSNVGGFSGIGNRVYFSAEANINTGNEPYYIDLADPCSLVDCPEGFTCFGGQCYEICYVPDLGEDIYSFTGEEVVLDGGSGFTSYRWSTGDTSQSIIIETTGTYVLEVGANCFTIEDGEFLYDTINVFFQCVEDTCRAGQVCIDGYCYPDPCYGVICPEGQTCVEGACFLDCDEVQPVDLGNDTVLIAGETLILDAGAGGTSYLWSTGDTTQTITVNATNTYWVDVVGDCFQLGGIENRDTILVEFICNDGICPEGMDCLNGLCYSDPCAMIDCPDGHACYQGVCYPSCSDLEFGADTILQPGQQLVLDAGSASGPYLWSTGDTTYSIIISQPGLYWLQSASGCIVANDSIKVSYICDGGNCPEGQICDNGLCIPEDACAGIECREGEVCFEGNCFQVNNCGLDLGPDIVAPAGTGILLDAGEGWDYVYWSSTNNYASQIIVNSTGTYIVLANGKQCGGYWDPEFYIDTINVQFTAYADGTCPPGQFNLNGYCYATDQSSLCYEGDYLHYSGTCRSIDPCDETFCPPGDTCYDGYCLPAFNPECDDCGPDEICYFGTCYPDCEINVSGGQTFGVIESDVFSHEVEFDYAIHYMTVPAGDTLRILPNDYFRNLIWSNGARDTLEVTYTGTYSFIAESVGENCTYFGQVTIEFVCPDEQCPADQVCRNGVCVPGDPCLYTGCPPGYSCHSGFCLSLPVQDCFSTPCPPGEVCLSGFCVTENSCTDVQCQPGETCVGGFCYPNAEYDLCDDVDCGGIYSCLYGSCMEMETVSGPANVSGFVAFATGAKKGVVGVEDLKAGTEVEGARVYLVNNEMDLVYKIDTTDSEGYFALNGVPEGTYKLVVESGLYSMDENNTIVIEPETGSYEILALIGEDMISIEEVTGSIQNEMDEEIAIYPNPTTGDLYLSAGTDLGSVTVSVIDLSGRTLVTRQVDFTGSEIQVVGERDGLVSGMYLLRITQQDALIAMERIIMQ